MDLWYASCSLWYSHRHFEILPYIILTQVLVKYLCDICSPLKQVTRIQLKIMPKILKNWRQKPYSHHLSETRPPFPGHLWRVKYSESVKSRNFQGEISLTKWSVSGVAGHSLCQPSSTTLCMCAQVTPYITCEHLVRFASSTVHPAAVAYYILHILKTKIKK